MDVVLPEIRIPDGYDIRLVDRLPEPRFSTMVRELILSNNTHITWDRLRDAQRLEIVAGRRQALKRPALRYGAWHGDVLIGFTYGWQDADERLYMAASAVEPVHRRRGVYSALVVSTLRWAVDEGFSEVWSRHVSTNNRVIIAKLKLGFLITGLEMSAAYGTLVHLTFPTEAIRREALMVRSGERPISKALAPFLVEPSGP
jgi:GNAT superfamily N-acetyltransferase